MDKLNAIRICNEIADDMERCANSVDGMPFIGKHLGDQAAAVMALAEVTRGMLESRETPEPYEELDILLRAASRELCAGS